MTLEYWHNPRCSKSRQGKDLLDAAGSTYTERRYVDDPPSAKELNLKALPHDRAQWIDVMVANPILIERPILVTSDGRAALGRPPEALQDLL